MHAHTFNPGDHAQIRNVSLPSYDWEYATIVRAESQRRDLGWGVIDRRGYVIRWTRTGEERWFDDDEVFLPSDHEPAYVDPDGTRHYAFRNGYGARAEIVKDVPPKRFRVTVLEPDDGVAYDTEGPSGIYETEPEAGVQNILQRVARLPKP